MADEQQQLEASSGRERSVSPLPKSRSRKAGEGSQAAIVMA
jgi:hypothetical protein